MYFGSVCPSGERSRYALRWTPGARARLFNLELTIRDWMLEI